jgi:hypothetical protein
MSRKTDLAVKTQVIAKRREAIMDRAKIQLELIKLKGGERLLRLTEPQSGLSLERKLNPERPVTNQKKQLLSVFEAALAQAELTTA